MSAPHNHGPGCFGKIGYSTRAQASEVKRHMRTKASFRSRGGLTVYLCRQCSKFHLGREKRTGVKTLRRVPDHEAGSFKARKARYVELTNK